MPIAPFEITLPEGTRHRLSIDNDFVDGHPPNRARYARTKAARLDGITTPVVAKIYYFTEEFGQRARREFDHEKAAFDSLGDSLLPHVVQYFGSASSHHWGVVVIERLGRTPWSWSLEHPDDVPLLTQVLLRDGLAAVLELDAHHVNHRDAHAGNFLLPLDCQELTEQTTIQMVDLGRARTDEAVGGLESMNTLGGMWYLDPPELMLRQRAHAGLGDDVFAVAVTAYTVASPGSLLPWTLNGERLPRSQTPNDEKARSLVFDPDFAVLDILPPQARSALEKILSTGVAERNSDVPGREAKVRAKLAGPLLGELGGNWGLDSAELKVRSDHHDGLTTQLMIAGQDTPQLPVPPTKQLTSTKPLKVARPVPSKSPQGLDQLRAELRQEGIDYLATISDLTRPTPTTSARTRGALVRLRSIQIPRQLLPITIGAAAMLGWAWLVQWLLPRLFWRNLTMQAWTLGQLSGSQWLVLVVGYLGAPMVLAAIGGVFKRPGRWALGWLIGVIVLALAQAGLASVAVRRPAPCAENAAAGSQLLCVDAVIPGWQIAASSDNPNKLTLTSSEMGCLGGVIIAGQHPRVLSRPSEWRAPQVVNPANPDETVQPQIVTRNGREVRHTYGPNTWVKFTAEPVVGREGIAVHSYAVVSGLQLSNLPLSYRGQRGVGSTQTWATFFLNGCPSDGLDAAEGQITDVLRAVKTNDPGRIAPPEVHLDPAQASSLGATADLLTVPVGTRIVPDWQDEATTAFPAYDGAVVFAWVRLDRPMVSTGNDPAMRAMVGLYPANTHQRGDVFQQTSWHVAANDPTLFLGVFGTSPESPQWEVAVKVNGRNGQLDPGLIRELLDGIRVGDYKEPL